MGYRQIWAAVSLSAVAFAFVQGCSSDDTVVALNIQSTRPLGEVGRLHVTFTQGSQPPVIQDFTGLASTTTSMTVDSGPDGAPITVMTAATTVPFFERVTLPSSWTSGDAQVQVAAFDAADMPYLSPPSVTFTLQASATTAVYVDLQPIPDGGTEAGDDAEADGGVEASEGANDATLGDTVGPDAARNGGDDAGDGAIDAPADGPRDATGG